jgi:hypothetical protein
MTERDEPEDFEKDLLSRTAYLNLGSDWDSLAYRLRIVAQYFGHVAETIDFNGVGLRCRPEIADRFEKVWLWFHDNLRRLPTSIGSRVHDIVGTTNPCEIIATMASLGEDQLERLRWKGSFPLSRWFPRLFPSEIVGLGLTPSRLLAAKIALKRLAPIIEHAADSIDRLDSDDDHDFYEDLGEDRAHYDPGLIDKNRLFALINIIRVEVNRAHNKRASDAILLRLDKIETCLRKQKVPWKTVLTAVIVLWGVMADLKTQCPGVYDGAADAVGQMVQVLHSDGQVQRSQRDLPNNRQEEDDEPDRPRETALLPAPIRRREVGNGDGFAE